MLKKKLVQVTAAAMAATMLFSVPAMAKKNFFSFNVKTSVNDGEAFSAGNPKNDAERQAYVVTQDSNIISTDAFYYAVFNYPKDTARYQYAYHTKMSSRTGTVHPQYYKSVTAGQTNVFTGRYGQIYRLGRWILVLIIMDYMCSKISFNKQSYNNYVA